jgi:hypothetical protein
MRSEDKDSSVPRPSREADDALGAGPSERFRKEFEEKAPIKCRVDISVEFEADTAEELGREIKFLFDGLRALQYDIDPEAATYVINDERFSYADMIKRGGGQMPKLLPGGPD